MSNNRLVQALYALGFADNLDSINRDRTIHQWAEAIETSPWLATHDAAIRVGERAKIAEAIRSKFLGPDFGRKFDGSESPAQKLYDAYDEGLESAALIAEAGRG